MRPSVILLLALALTLLLGGCTMIDVRMAPGGGLHSDAFISGYVDAGWPASNSLLQVGLLDGPSRGALFYFQLWKLLRVELGFLGLALGVGPLDAGIGVLFYEPHPPLYTGDQGEWHDADHGEHGEHEMHGVHDDHAKACEDCDAACEEECCEVDDDDSTATSARFSGEQKLIINTLF